MVSLKGKNGIMKEMVNFVLYSRLSQGFLGEAMLTACYLLNRVSNKRNMITHYDLWTKRKPNLNCLRFWGCKVVVRLPDLKLKTLGEIGIENIFVGYVKNFKAFSFNVIEPNKSVLISLIIESRDVIFDKNRFSSVPIPSQRSLINETKDIGGSVVPKRSLNSLIIHQMDVKTSFLNGELDEKVTEHPDSDRGIREFKSLMQFSECSFFIESNSGLNDIHQMASALYSLSSKLKDTIME
nr:zinc finger, CCHC-type [Tanacetum cinerariifolium]